MVGACAVALLEGGRVTDRVADRRVDHGIDPAEDCGLVRDVDRGVNREVAHSVAFVDDWNMLTMCSVSCSTSP